MSKIAVIKEELKNNLPRVAFFSFILFIQCVLFNWLSFHCVIVSSLWNNFSEFAAYYLPKLSIVLFIASFLCLFKCCCVDLLCFVLMTVWMYIEILYVRSYEMFLPATSMLIANNLNGFTESLKMYMHLEDLLLVVLPLVYAFYAFFNKKKYRSYIGFIVVLCISFLINCVGLCFRYNIIAPSGCYISCVNPIANTTIRPYGGVTCMGYVRDFSPIHHLLRNCYELCLYSCNKGTDVSFSEDELAFLSNRIVTDSVSTRLVPNSSLLIILVESLEGWSITEESTPFMYSLANDSHCLFAPNIISQQRAGMSSDGQMIVMTGLLPLRESIAVFDYPFNVYPSISDVYSQAKCKTTGIFPTPMSCWNQMYMNEAYKIQQGLSCEGDYNVFAKTSELLAKSDFVLTVTISTHTPFEAYADSSNLNLPPDMPEYMRKYLRSVNYVDNKIRDLFNNMANCGLLDRYTVVITGDHTILPSDIREECRRYSTEQKMSYQVQNKSCPLIIYSPKQDKNIVVREDAYQMDIFPSILYAIGCEDYYWKGMGENLYKPINRERNCLSVSQIEVLSDKIIKKNIFKEYSE